MLKSEIKKLIIILAIIWGLMYLLSYLAYRQTHIQVWEQDHREYVMFSESKIYLYYFFRPLRWIDEEFTGMNFHIGPHR
jgi:hypothetical protein